MSATREKGVRLIFKNEFGGDVALTRQEFIDRWLGETGQLYRLVSKSEHWDQIQEIKAVVQKMAEETWDKLLEDQKKGDF